MILRLMQAQFRNLLKTSKLKTTPDSVQFKYAKNCYVYFTFFASEIFRISLDTGELPTYWRNTYIIPLYKTKEAQVTVTPKIIGLLHYRTHY